MELGVRIEGVRHLGEAAGRRTVVPLQARGSRAVGLAGGSLFLLREEDTEEPGGQLGEGTPPPLDGGARGVWPVGVALRDLAW
jgi:hypothetical protein